MYVPTGDPEIDRKLRELASQLSHRDASLGLLLDMLNVTRAQVGGRAGPAPATACL